MGPSPLGSPYRNVTRGELLARLNIWRWPWAWSGAQECSLDELEQACAESELFDPTWYLEQNPDVAAARVDPLFHYLRWGAAKGLDPNPLFDTRWYLERNPNVATTRMNPLGHFSRWGIARGLDPSPLFHTDWYLERYPDVAAANVNPLLHYLRWGAAEGLDPNPLFDTDWYVERNPDVAAAGINPLVHYMRWGVAKRLDPSPLFDTVWYLERNPDVAAAGLDPLAHYLHWGGRRDPSPLFDAGWYLERNPDVAAAGMNPLVHYLRWGAAKGLDPSPLFDAAWYLERNPDVAAASINPYVHYLRWGAGEKREPVSPIPKLFERLSRKPKGGPAEFDDIRRIYTPPLALPVHKASADNNIEVGVGWAEHFMSSSLESLDKGDIEAALRLAKYAAQTWPHEDDPITLYSLIFAEANREALEAFTYQFAQAKLLVLHISYKLGVSQAEASCRSFHDPTGTIANLIVVGGALPEDTFQFDADSSILLVPADDSYEALPQKVAKAFLFIGLCQLSIPVLKVDDDAVCEDISRLEQLADDTFSRYLYGGRVNPRSSTASCSFWHFGKCTDQSVNYRPDGLLWLAAYAGGQGYWLNGKAAGAMAKISLLHERHFEVERFEDRAVGTALAQYGVRPHHLDLIKAGILSDLNQPPAAAKKPPARLRGSPACDQEASACREVQTGFAPGRARGAGLRGGGSFQ